MVAIFHESFRSSQFQKMCSAFLWICCVGRLKNALPPSGIVKSNCLQINNPGHSEGFLVGPGGRAREAVQRRYDERSTHGLFIFQDRAEPKRPLLGGWGRYASPQV